MKPLGLVWLLMNLFFPTQISYLTFKEGSSLINNLPLKWTYEEIVNDYKLLDNNIKFKFIDVFNQKSIIKLDLILEKNNQFIEFSEVKKNRK